jgi:hypothetical protein
VVTNLIVMMVPMLGVTASVTINFRQILAELVYKSILQRRHAYFYIRTYMKVSRQYQE